MTTFGRAQSVKRIAMVAALPLSLVAAPGAALGACPADVSPAGGDGVVNINDLLEVINHWGPCPAPCPPRCATDIAPLVAGNCATNIDDLLEVINNWGACPCSPSGTWTSAPPATYTCAFGLVNFNITQWTFGGSATNMSVTGAPLLMTGPAVSCNAGQTFSVSGTLPGTCAETYTLTGTFNSPTQFTGTFSAAYVGQTCALVSPPCTNQSWNITATRVP